MRWRVWSDIRIQTNNLHPIVIPPKAGIQNEQLLSDKLDAWARGCPRLKIPISRRANAPYK